MSTKMNPFTRKLDFVSTKTVSAAPASGDEGVLYMISGDPAKSYYFLGGSRYRIDSILDNPATGGAGSPMGLLLTLTYNA